MPATKIFTLFPATKFKSGVLLLPLFLGGEGCQEATQSYVEVITSIEATAMPRPTLNPSGIPLTASERQSRWKQAHEKDRCVRRFFMPKGCALLLDQDAAQLGVSDSVYLAAAIQLAAEHHEAMTQRIGEVRRRFGMQVHPRSASRGSARRSDRRVVPLEKLLGNP